jgi:predicted SnoaL-like aldol condensation-catalyzing enzyme
MDLISPVQEVDGVKVLRVQTRDDQNRRTTCWFKILRIEDNWIVVWDHFAKKERRFDEIDGQEQGGTVSRPYAGEALKKMGGV